MYGYIKVEKKLLKENELSLYNTFLCGLCLSTKKLFGNVPRLTVNYDINFFNILFHSFCDEETTIDMSRCATSPWRKHTVLRVTELTDLLSIGSLLLLHVKTLDDNADKGNVLKRGVHKFLLPYFDKAIKLMPELSKNLLICYDTLSSLEREKCSSLDRVCDPFSQMSLFFAHEILKSKSNQKIESLCYNVGKWVYLIDALDDLKDDLRSKRYNPLTACFTERVYTGADSFISANSEELQYVFYSTLNCIARDFNDLELSKFKCILTNIIYYSMRNRTNKLLGIVESTCGEQAVQQKEDAYNESV